MIKTRVVVVVALLSFATAGLQAQPPQRSRFQMWDKNQDGKLSQDELPAQAQSRLKQLDANGDGLVTEHEMDTFRSRRSRSMSGSARRTESATQGRGKSEGEFYAPPAMQERVQSRLKIGDDAPDFALKTSDGSDVISLSQFKSKKPVVLVFGSITCGPFRDKVTQVFDLHQQYGDKVEFLMIYIREAHPESTIRIPAEDGTISLEKFTQSDLLATRVENAQSCGALLKVPFPMLIDGEDNIALSAYGGWPNRLVVVGRDGNIAWDSGQGPRGFQPQQLGQWLRANL